MNLSYEEYIKEFDNTGAENLSDLVRLGGVELARELEIKGLVILYRYATHDDFCDEIDGVYMDEDIIVRQLREIAPRLSSKEHRAIVSKWLADNNHQ